MCQNSLRLNFPNTKTNFVIKLLDFKFGDHCNDSLIPLVGDRVCAKAMKNQNNNQPNKINKISKTININTSNLHGNP